MKIKCSCGATFSSIHSFKTHLEINKIFNRGGFLRHTLLTAKVPVYSIKQMISTTKASMKF